jgi:hypothetical protein
MVRPAMKNIILNQDYGYKDSWIDNWNMTWEEDDTTLPKGWSQTSGTNSEPLGASLGDSKAGIISIVLIQQLLMDIIFIKHLVQVH